MPQPRFHWKQYRDLFESRPSLEGDEGQAPVYLLLDQGVILEAFGAGADYGDWKGMAYSDLELDQLKNDLVVFERDEVESLLGECKDLAHFGLQSQHLKTKMGMKVEECVRSSDQLGTKKKTQKSLSKVLSKRHFLLHAVESWWKRFLPPRFGILLEVTESSRETRSLLQFDRGELVHFDVPDMTGMTGINNLRERVRFLNEKEVQPILGIRCKQSEWKNWSRSETPWKLIHAAFKKQECEMEPKNGQVKFLLSLRARFGL